MVLVASCERSKKRLRISKLIRFYVGIRICLCSQSEQSFSFPLSTEARSTMSPTSWLLALAVLINLVAQGAAAVDSRGKSVSITLRARWEARCPGLTAAALHACSPALLLRQATPLALEAAEFLSDESDELFWQYVESWAEGAAPVSHFTCFSRRDASAPGPLRALSRCRCA